MQLTCAPARPPCSRRQESRASFSTVVPAGPYACQAAAVGRAVLGTGIAGSRGGRDSTSYFDDRENLVDPLRIYSLLSIEYPLQILIPILQSIEHLLNLQTATMGASFYTILGGAIALAGLYLYLFGISPELKRKMERQALKTMGENKMSYLAKGPSSLPTSLVSCRYSDHLLTTH